MNEDIKLRRQSSVVVTGYLPGGTSVFQIITMDHDAGAPASALIGQAFLLIRQTGGISVDVENAEEMDFYPLSRFEKTNFAVRAISLAATGLRVQ